MVLKINKLLFLVIFIILISFNCKSQPVRFDFLGRLVLYSNKVGINYELVLLNVDKKQELKLPRFDEVEGSDFILFDGGKKVLVNSYEYSGKIFIYNISDNTSSNINTHSMSGFNNVTIYNNDLYFSNQMSIYRYSLVNDNVVGKYSTDSLISDFAVYDTNLIAINFGAYDYAIDAYRLSNIFLYDFSKNNKNEIPFRAFLYGWSNDRKYFLFNSRGPKILNFPAFTIQSINSIYEDSLKIFREMRFIGNSEIILAACKQDENFDKTNLYILDITSKTIKQITNTNSLKEIKSTFY